METIAGLGKEQQIVGIVSIASNASFSQLRAMSTSIDPVIQCVCIQIVHSVNTHLSFLSVFDIQLAAAIWYIYLKERLL